MRWSCAERMRRWSGGGYGRGGQDTVGVAGWSTAKDGSARAMLGAGPAQHTLGHSQSCTAGARAPLSHFQSAEGRMIPLGGPANAAAAGAQVAAAGTRRRGKACGCESPFGSGGRLRHWQRRNWTVRLIAADLSPDICLAQWPGERCLRFCFIPSEN
jgi:hypothetical protein